LDYHVTTLREAFDAVLKGRSLDAPAASAVFGEIVDGVAPDVLVAGFLVALRLKGETAAELAGGTRAMLERARPLELGSTPLLDTAGTGGDGAGTFNISTGAARVAATAGISVAKHGNRAISGRVGAADVLERLGVRLELDVAGLRTCLERAGMCFVFAPAYHPALARLAPLRRTLGTRTAFNLMAPIANPARPRYQLLGVAEPRLLRPIAEALAALEVEHAMVVHGHDGLDEISLAAPTSVIEVRGTQLKSCEIVPSVFDFESPRPADLLTADPGEAMALLRRALAGEPGAARDVLALNGGAAIYVGGGAPTLAAGIAIAREVLATGRALATIEKLCAASQSVVETRR
jgi:anthranilate phosphoribosyltransferase